MKIIRLIKNWTSAYYELEAIKRQLAEHFGGLPDDDVIAGLDHLLAEINLYKTAADTNASFQDVLDLKNERDEFLGKAEIRGQQITALLARLEWLEGLVQRAHALLERHDATAAELLWMAYSNPPQKDGVS